MATARTPGKGKLAADLSKVPASEAQPQPEAPAKTGIETIRDKDEDFVRVVDHDSNKVLFSGTAAEHRALKKALSGD